MTWALGRGHQRAERGGVWLLNRLESGPSQQTRSLLVTACWEQGLGFRWLFPGSLVIAELGPVLHIWVIRNAAETGSVPCTRDFFFLHFPY